MPRLYLPSVSFAILGILLVSLLVPIDAQAQRIAASVDSTASVIDYTGSATMHDWTGTSRKVSGTMVLDLDSPDSSRVVIRAPVASFESGPERRDREMREVTEAEKYPIVEFRSTEIRPVNWTGTGSGRTGQWRVTGDLRFHGQTHPVNATVGVRTTADSVHAHAQFPISLTRFDVERPKLLWVAPIADTIRIDARISGRIQPTDSPESRLQTSHSEVAGTRRVASSELRAITPLQYDGLRAGLRAEVQTRSDGARNWLLSFYGFDESATGLAGAQDVVLRADRRALHPIEVEGETHQLDDGTAVDISRMQLSRADFKVVAQALTVTARIGSARFFVDWMARRDMRLILSDVPPDSSRPVSSREDD